MNKIQDINKVHIGTRVAWWNKFKFNFALLSNVSRIQSKQETMKFLCYSGTPLQLT